MRNIGLVLLIVSVLLGAGAVWGVRNIAASRAAPSARVGETQVVVATRPIGFGEVLTPESVRVQAWPSGAKPAGSFQTVAQLTSGPKRVALGAIAANEPILASRISGPGGRATLSGVIRTGMRASTIRVDDVFGVAGFVLPGDIVDVLVTRSEGQSGNEQMRTDVLLESVRVLAVDQLANENKNDPVVAKAATIEVTPEQAQKLALASQVGTLSLALRGTVDPTTPVGPTARTIRVGDLRLAGLTIERPQVRPAARRAVRLVNRSSSRAPSTIEIYHGSSPSRVAVLPD